MATLAARFDHLKRHAERAMSQDRGEVRIGGLRGNVTVQRDRWGVAHIFAGSLYDLYYAQGFVTASDRLFQIEMSFRAGTGRISELFGPTTLSADRWLRVIGVSLTEARVARSIDSLSREISHAWTAGVRAYIERMPARPIEYEILDAEPWMPTPEQAETLLSATKLNALIPMNIDMELLRLALIEKVGWEGMRELCPGSPAVPAGAVSGKAPTGSAIALLKALPRVLPDAGSNSWVIAGNRTASGFPMVAEASDVGFLVPSSYYEIHLSAPGVDVSGASIPGMPGVYLGRTATTAWAMSAAPGDFQDLYLEQIDDDRGAALYRGDWEALHERTEEIWIRGRAEPERVRIRETRHGPLLDSSVDGISGIGGIQIPARPGPYALRWTHRDVTFNISVLHHMATATTFSEFRKALAGWTTTAMNVVFGNAAGEIGYQIAGVWPDREAGDGSIPVPGWTGEYEWRGMIPFEDLPHAHNPAQGYLANANNRIDDDSFPHNLGRDFLPDHRARRIAELIAATDRHSFETTIAAQLDTTSIEARELLPVLTSIAPETEAQRDALARLTDWDADLKPDSVAACIYEIWLKHLAAAMLEPALGHELAQIYYNRCGATEFRSLLTYPSATWFRRHGVEPRDEVLRKALDSAIAELTTELGAQAEAWRWGAIHQVLMTHQLLMPKEGRGLFQGPSADVDDRDDKAVREFLTAGRWGVGGDGDTVNNTAYIPSAGYRATSGAGIRFIIDLRDPDSAISVTVHGQSGNPASTHFKDQAEMRLTGGYHPMPFTRPAVDAATEATLELLPS